MTYYYIGMVVLWQELDLHSNDKWVCTGECVRYKTKLEDVFEFLVGLNQDINDVRGRVLSRQPLSTMREVFSKVRHKEQHQGMMMVDGTGSVVTRDDIGSAVTRDGSGFMTRGDHE